MARRVVNAEEPKSVLAETLEIPVQRGEQDGVTLYLGWVPAGVLAVRGVIDHFRNENGEDKGYQRSLEPRRVKAVASYLRAAGSKILPGSILINIRASEAHMLTFRETHGGFGSLTVPAGVSLYIVDGQHRVKGLGYAINDMGQKRLDRFPMAIVITAGLTLEEEADQFRIINETAKKVPTDLARRVLAQQVTRLGRPGLLTMERLWEADGSRVCELLNMTEGSPWKGRIQPPNKRKDKTHTVKETSFVSSLKPILGRDRPLFKRTAESVAPILIDYWSVWSELVPEPFEYPSEYVLLKTPGVFALHRLAAVIFEVCLQRKLHLRKDTFLDALKYISPEHLAPSFWKSEVDPEKPEGAAVYGSMKGFMLLADTLGFDLQDHGWEIDLRGES